MAIYRPGQVPSDAASLPAFLDRELRNLSTAMQEANQYLLLDVSYAAPQKVKDGMIAMADGTTWNPGSGAGAYIYRGASWHFLG